MAIYIKLDKKPSTIKELITKLFSVKPVYQEVIKSVTSYEVIKSVTSYFDKECTIIQCNSNKLRSVDEVLEITKTYFPEMEDKEILLELLTTTIIFNNELYYLYGSNCSTINKSVVGFYNNFQYINKHAFNNIRVGSIYVFNCKYTWEKVCEVIGLTHEKACSLIKSNYMEVLNGKRNIE